MILIKTLEIDYYFIVPVLRLLSRIQMELSSAILTAKEISWGGKELGVYTYWDVIGQNLCW